MVIFLIVWLFAIANHVLSLFLSQKCPYHPSSNNINGYKPLCPPDPSRHLFPNICITYILINLNTPLVGLQRDALFSLWVLHQIFGSRFQHTDKNLDPIGSKIL